LLNIDFQPEVRPDPVGWEHRRDPGAASAGDLLWYYFLGDIRISAGGTEFVSKFGSIPLLHFISGALAASDTLAEQSVSSYAYQLTETDDQIIFKRNGDVLTIECTFAHGVATASFRDFPSAVYSFAQREIQKVLHDFPSLRQHPVVEGLSRRCGLENR
jgi:hypothetical protein